MKFKLDFPIDPPKIIDNVEFYDVGPDGSLTILGGERDKKGNFKSQLIIADQGWYSFERID